MRHLITALLAGLGALPCPAQDHPAIALVEVPGSRGPTAEISSYARGVLEEELSQSGEFDLVERGQTKAVLEELAFQQSGVTDAKTVAEIGRHLNVSKLYFCQVHRLHPEYKLTVKIVDVATNRVLRTETTDLGRGGTQIEAATRKLAARLVQGAPLLTPAEMVDIPAGSFLMGSAVGPPDEQPAHQVSISAFRLDRQEVSRIAYQAFLESQQKVRKTSVENPEHPAALVSWSDAAAYCGWAGKRLPTEAEWEYAARGPEARTYPWGNNPPDGSRAHFGGRTREPVGVDALPRGATPEGVLNMAGNVAEWVQDWWRPDYYAASPSADPPGPAQGDYRTVRGGSWSQPGAELRAAARSFHNPDKGAAYIGFRCARAGESPSRP